VQHGVPRETTFRSFRRMGEIAAAGIRSDWSSGCSANVVPGSLKTPAVLHGFAADIAPLSGIAVCVFSRTVRRQSMHRAGFRLARC